MSYYFIYLLGSVKTTYCGLSKTFCWLGTVKKFLLIVFHPCNCFFLQINKHEAYSRFIEIEFVTAALCSKKKENGEESHQHKNKNLKMNKMYNKKN